MTIVGRESLRFSEPVETLLGLAWEELGPGVLGYSHRSDPTGCIYFSVIEAVSEGNGDVGRWLDSLPTDETYRIPMVINPRLQGMLRRRGWATSYEWFEHANEHVHVYERKATT